MTLPLTSRPPGSDVEVLIPEARRRQRKRWLTYAIALILVGGSVGAGVTLSGGAHHPRRLSGSPPSTRPRNAASGPGEIPREVGTRLLMWTPGAAYLDDLSTRQVSTDAPILSHFAYGDYQPLAIVAGDRLVYNSNGVKETAPFLRGPSRLLARSDGFAPAAVGGQVWLTSEANGHPVARLVSLGTRATLRTVVLPTGSELIAGTSAGLLIERYTRTTQPLVLWWPGRRPRPIPGTLTDGFAVTADTISYGRDCRNLDPTGSYEPEACRFLVMRSLRTARTVRYRTPLRTLGWVPDEFNLVNNVNGTGRQLAAVAATSSRHPARGHLYLVSLRGPRELQAVPGETSTLAKVAWSIHGDWLFYQGADHRLHAFQPASGRAAVTATPCCQYTVMAALPSR